LVVIHEPVLEISCGQKQCAHTDRQTDTHTHRQTHAADHKTLRPTARR